MTSIKLDYPVDFEGGKLTEITLRRPRVSDSISARRKSRETSEQEIHLIASLAELPPSAIEELDMADYAKLQTVLESFFGLSESIA